MAQTGKIRIAVQKSGRLYEDSVRLLKECGIDLRNVKDRLKTESDNFPLEVFFLRDDDIPQYVEDGVADIGIVGENVLYEKCKEADLLERLELVKCRLTLAINKNEEYGANYLQGKRLATSYPVLLQKYLDDNKVCAEIHEISGSVEIAPGIGLAEVICDLVSSGSTLFMNGLKEVETILESQAVLIKNKELDEERLRLVGKLLFRIRSVKKAQRNKYILLNAPNEQLPA